MLSKLHRCFFRLRAVLSKSRREQDMAAEMRDHLDSLTARHLASGMSPENARNAALRDFGGVEQVKELAREQQAWLWPEQLLQDLRFACRSLIKRPGFTIIAVLTLALGIGANTAIFSIVNAVLLRPLPYPAADRIMVLNESSGPGQDYSVALPDYFDWQKDNTVFEHLAATHKESRNLSGIPGRDPERVSCAAVTRNFFNIIGLPPEIGRTFSEEEDKVG